MNKVLIVCAKIRNDAILQQCLIYLAKSYDLVIKSRAQIAKVAIEQYHRQKLAKKRAVEYHTFLI